MVAIKFTFSVKDKPFDGYYENSIETDIEYCHIQKCEYYLLKTLLNNSLI